MITENSTLAEVNAAVEAAKIATDNHVMQEHYTSELSDCGPETALMPNGQMTEHDVIQPSKTVLTDLYDNLTQEDKMLVDYVRSCYPDVEKGE